MSKIKPIHIIFSVFIVLLVCVLGFGGKQKDPAYTPTKFYTLDGTELIHQMKVVTDTVVCSSGNGFSIDLSSMGYIVRPTVNVIALRSTATATAVPNVSIKSLTTTNVTVNVTEGNGSIVTILGLNVLQGASTQFTSAPVTLIIQAMGYSN